MSKKIFLDGLANYIFFTPIVAIGTGYFLAHWTQMQYIDYLVFTAIPVGFLGGIIFGRFINKWRKWFNYQ